LALDREAVLLLAADLLAPGDVLRRLTHRDVDVRVLFGVAGKQPRVLRVRLVRVAVLVARDALDPDRQEHVALTRLDGVLGDPRGHERRRAVAVHRHARNVDAGKDRDDAADVVALLPRRKAAAADEVFDLAV